VNPVTRGKQHDLRAEQFLAALVESSDDAIIGKSLEGTVLSWNGAAERLYGFSAGEMLGKNIAAVIPPDRADELEGILADVRQGKIVRDLLTERLRKDGTRVPLSITVSPVVGPDGTAVGASTIARDVSAYIQVVEELSQAQRVTAETLSVLETLQESAPVGFGFIDRDFRVVRINEILASVNGSSVAHQIGHKVPEMLPELWPQIEPDYRRVMDTGESVVNVEVSGEMATDPGRLRHCLTSYYPVRVADEIIGIGVVAVDITERKHADEAQKALTRAAVAAIAATTEARDPYTDGHQSRVAALATTVAADLGVDASTIEGIDLAARIHDIGKIAIPVEILTRSTKLSPPEWELIKTHSRIGADIVRGIEFPWPVAEMIEQHHERLDGSGYPDGLHGDEILLGARIIAVADVVEAMASHRPYRPALGVEVALEEIERQRGTLFDSRVVDVCLRMFREGRYSLDRKKAATAEVLAGDRQADAVGLIRSRSGYRAN